MKTSDGGVLHGVDSLMDDRAMSLGPGARKLRISKASLIGMAVVAMVGSVGGAMSVAATSAVNRSEENLRSLSAKRRLVFGTAVPAQCLRDDADGGRFNDTLAKNFNLIELENDLKPPSIWRGPRDYHFTDVDFVVGAPGAKGWAQKHKMKVRGHVLVYARDDGYTLPRWLHDSGEKLTKEEAQGLLHDYILALASRYRGKIAMWDVVNEAIDDQPNKNAFNLRNSFWFRKLGPEFLVLAFKWAHEADPKAELYYNEYGVEGGGPKAGHMMDLAKWLIQQGAPISGLGLQYHVGCHTKIEPGDGHYKLLEEIQRLGLLAMITELDVAVPIQQAPRNDPQYGLVAKDPTDLELQADVYVSMLRMARAFKNCHRVNLWGLSDGHSWIPGFSGGHNGAATLFDKEFQPKPAYNALLAALRK